MPNLYLGVAAVLSKYKVMKLEDLEFDKITVADLKKTVSQKIDLPEDSFDICLDGLVLEDDKTLLEYELEEDIMVHVFRHKEKKPVPSSPITLEQTKELLRMFEKNCSVMSFRKALHKYVTPDFTKILLSRINEMVEDITTCTLLTRPDILSRLSSESAEKIHKEHPFLASALRLIMDSMKNYWHPNNNGATRTTQSPSSGSDDGDWAENQGSEGNHASSEFPAGNSERDTRIQITQEALTLALQQAIARAEISRRNAEAAAATPSNTPAEDERMDVVMESLQNAVQLPPFQHNLESLPEAIVEPMESDDQAESVPHIPSEAQVASFVTPERLEALNRLGFTDTVLNTQALQIGNGDVETAANVLLSGILPTSQ